jgi:Major capsid protein 13-like
MAKVKIEDILFATELMEYVVQRTAELSALFASGIVRTDPLLDAIAAGSGKTFDLPFWNDLTGESEELSDSAALGTDKIGAQKDTAVKHFRGKGWSSNDLAAALSGTDPMKVIGDLLAAFWARDMQKVVLIPTLKGMFANALATTHVLDIARVTAGAADATHKVSSDVIIDAAGKLGDSWEKIKAMAVHSTVFQNFQKQNMIDFVPLADQDTMIPFYQGRRVIVDDGLDVVAAAGGIPAKYSTYLFGEGCIGYGDGGPNADEALEPDRDAAAGDDLLFSRKHFLLHPRGVAYTGAVAGVSPTKTELATAGNWARKWEVKNIPIIKLVTSG